jgi:multidrug transporter EmrE-like cation transporter
MAPAYKTLPAGVVYAVWSGLGIVAITALGVVYFEEKLDLFQYGFIGLIFIGAVGLSLTTNSTSH